MSFFQNTKKSIHHDKCYIAFQIFLSFKNHRWKRIGASLALAGYLNQILSPFLVISSLFFTSPLEAMDDDQHYKTTMAASLKSSKEEEELEPLKYEDHDVQTAIDLTLSLNLKKIVR